MPNITRGDRMGGLLAYLQGPGRANEHTEPHLVAGDPAIMAWHDDVVLDRATALSVAAQLEHPRRAFGVDVSGGSVWHCSLSLRASEGQLSDATWAAIAQDFVIEMGFAGDDERLGEETSLHGGAGGRAPCRWVAVRHGLSSGGNDHIHIAVSLVREDGTKASVWNDRPRAQRIVGELERVHGLEVLESRNAGRGSRGVKPAEVAAATRRGDHETARSALARIVRGAAVAAADEAEFVRRMRRDGVLVRPRYAAGRDDVVAGYSVALYTRARTSAGDRERPVWFGGGHLDRDLSLPRLRLQWPDSPAKATAAVDEWNAGRRGRRPVRPGRECVEPSPNLWQQYGQDVAAMREELRRVPVGDRAAWAQVAHEVSGAFAAWSVRVELVPGPLAATAARLARSAQVRSHEVHSSTATQARHSRPIKSAAMLLASLPKGGTGTLAQAVMFRQLANMAKAVHDAHLAANEARSAADIASVVRSELASVRASLPEVPGNSGVQRHASTGGRSAQEGVDGVTNGEAAPVRRLRSPLPSDLRRGPRHGAGLPCTATSAGRGVGQ